MRLKSNPLTPEQEDIFWSHVDVEPGLCWEWTDRLNPYGYGDFWIPDTKNERAHRLTYLILVGPIPKGHVLHHHCHNRKCCNPDHTEPMTQKEHSKQHNTIKQFCKRGHPVSPDTYRNGVCLLCKRLRYRQYRAEGRPHVYPSGPPALIL